MANELSFTINRDMTKEKLRKIIGNNIRIAREARGFSIEMLAEILGLSTSFVGLIERGQRGTTAHNLYRISEIFDMPIDKLVFSTELDANSIKEDEPTATKRERILSYLYNFSEPELDYIFDSLVKLKALQKIYCSRKAGQVAQNDADDEFDEVVAALRKQDEFNYDY